MNTRLILSLVVIVVLLTGVGGATAHQGANSPAASQAALGTGFTFQGQLKNAGATVNGNCDMTFRLYDDATTGAQIGSAITTTVPVSNSLFTVMLNSGGEFGANAFNGDARWLEVSVKCAGDATFTALTPRQQITAAPYAQYSLAGNTGAASTWIQLSPRNTPPSPRNLVSGAYDVANDRIIFFSGGTGLPMPTDVWVLTNASAQSGTPGWAQLSPVGGPPQGRNGATGTYDPVSNRLIVHGGCLGGCSPVSSSTWVLSNTNGLGGTPGWTQLPDAPIARAEHSAVYDPGSNRMIIFGGHTGFYGTDRNDVWVLTDANGIGNPAWIQLSPTGTPPTPRRGSGAVYDPATNRLILFGGANFPSNPINATFFNDVWVLTNANGLGGTPQWLQLAPTGALPMTRDGSAVTYDPSTNRITVFGGRYVDPVGVESYFSDVWVLAEANGVGGSPHWIQASTNGSLPTARSFSLAAYSPTINRLILTMGYTPSGNVNEAWILTNANGLVR